MTKSLDAILATAREKISAANPAGRNTGAATPTTLGKEPGVDYAPKAGDERKFVAKHTHIEQEYPNGMKHAFTGDGVDYSMDKPEMKNFGNKQDQAIKANEEVEQVDELSKKTLISYRKKSAQQYFDSTLDKPNWKPGAKKTAEKRGYGLDRSYDQLAKKNAKNEDFAGVPGPVTVDKKAVNAECCCPALECPIHTKLKANTKTNVGGMVKVKVGGFEKKTEETLHEISKKLAGSYLAKATSSYRKHANAADKTKGKEQDRHIDTALKRNAGMKQANSRLLGTKKTSVKEDSNPNVQPIQTSGPAKKDPPVTLGSNNKDLKNKGKTITVGDAAVGKGKMKEELTPEQIAAVIAAPINEFSIHLKRPGALTRKAKSEGESNSKYEQEHKHDKGLSGKQARFAINAKKWHHEETEVDEGKVPASGGKARFDALEKKGKGYQPPPVKKEDVDETAPLIEGNSKEGYMARGKASYHGEMTRWHNDHKHSYTEIGNMDRAGWHEMAADSHDEAARHYGHAAHFHSLGRQAKARNHENAASGWGYQASDHEHAHKLVMPAHDMAEEMEIIEAAVLCDKGSLRKKMKYHKGKMKAEEIGSPKFKHHQRQIHTIKGMLEEADPEELDETKARDNAYEYKMNSKGFLVKKRKYEPKEEKKKKETKEEVEDPTVARIKSFMDKQ